MENKGIGGIITLALSIVFVSAGMAAGAGDEANGEKLWKIKKCNNCHKPTEKKKSVLELKELQKDGVKDG